MNAASIGPSIITWGDMDDQLTENGRDLFDRFYVLRNWAKK